MKPWRHATWCLQTQPDANFVCAMETVLDTYQRPVDPACPVVCVDEQLRHLHAEVQAPQPVQPGQAHRHAYAYRRHGTRNLCMATAPLQGWRHVKVTARRTRIDFAWFLTDLVEVHFPAAARIVVVCDNRNPHTPGGLYEIHDPATARRIARQLEWVYTPKHGSWLNIAEIELSVLTRQCLGRRLADADMLRTEIEAWARRRNRQGAPVPWRFTTADARIKLRKLYPSI